MEQRISGYVLSKPNSVTGGVWYGTNTVHGMTGRIEEAKVYATREDCIRARTRRTGGWQCVSVDVPSPRA